jgi:glycosyltransferase involved in cell wall biosynthesis
MSLSIIIPAYNEEKYIENTLKAINLGETIVVCNGCTDNTAQIAKKYASKVIEIKEKGVSKARNIGAKSASNERLVFLDADIIVSNTILTKIKNSSFTIGSSKVKPNSSKLKHRIFMNIKTNLNYFGFSSGLIFCDKNLFNRVGGFNELQSKGEDGQFLRRAKRKGNFGVVNAYVFNHMRRFERLGYSKIIFYWTKEFFFKSKKEYESIR